MEKIWKIQQLERHVETGVVTTVYWRYEVVDGDYVAGYGEPLKLVDDYTNIDTENGFITFDELSEESVIEWVKDTLGEDYIHHMNERLVEDINAHNIQINSFSFGLPWEDDVIEDEV